KFAADSDQHGRRDLPVGRVADPLGTPSVGAPRPSERGRGVRAERAAERPGSTYLASVAKAGLKPTMLPSGRRSTRLVWPQREGAPSRATNAAVSTSGSWPQGVQVYSCWSRFGSPSNAWRM